MQAEDNLPTEAWGQALAKARTDEDLNIDSLSRELMLSIAQVRGLESGSLTAFHGVTYYLRALQKYAERLNVTLEPAPQTFIDAMAASKAATTRGRTRQKSAPRALDYELPGGAHRRSRVGRWVVIIAILVIGTGVYLALQEGWPSSSTVNEMAEARNNNRTVATRSDDTASRSPTTQAATSTSTTNPDETSMPESTVSSSEHTQIAKVDSDNTTTTTERSNDQVAAASNDTVTVASVDLTKNESANLSVDAEPTPKQEDAAASNTPEAASTSGTDVSDTQDNEQSPQSLIQRRTSTNALVLTFTGDCWVEVRQDTGQITQKVYKAGESLEVPLNETERIVLGNITAVEAERAGKALDLTEFTRGSATVARINVPALLGED